MQTQPSNPGPREVLWSENPYDLSECTRTPVLGKMTIREWLDANGGEDRLNRKPTVCYYKGQQLMRAEYKDYLITSRVCFIAMPQDGGEGGSNPLAAVAILALSVFAAPAAMALAGTTAATAGIGTYALQAGIMMAGGMLINAVFPPPEPPKGAIPSQGSPTYSVGAQGNQARLGSPIPVNYGRFRITPDFAAQPWTEFEGNEQYLYMLFSIGQGRHKLSGIRFVKTSIDHFDEVSVQIVNPHEKVTLFPTGIVIAPEAGGQDMNTTGSQGPFVVNKVDTEITRIAVDLVFPSGLISMDDDGDEHTASVHVQVSAEPIDSEGNTTGSALILVDKAISRRDRTAQRISLSGEVPAGRYQVTITRSTPAGGNYDAKNMQLAGVRGYLVSDNEYGDVTLLAMRVRASENLSNTASRMVNLLQERMIPTWHPTPAGVTR